MKALSHSAAARSYTVARIAVLAWLLYIVISTVQFLPARYQNIRSLDYSSSGGGIFEEWTAGQLHSVVSELGVRPDVLAVIILTFSLIGLLIFWGTGALLWSRSGTWIGLMAAFVLFSTGPGFSQLLQTKPPPGSWNSIPFFLGAVLIWPTFFNSLYLFPNGRFVPRFSRYLAILPYLLFLVINVFPTNEPVADFGFLAVIAYVLAGLVSQVYRYRIVSTPDERQQTKWVVAALCLFVAVLATSAVPVTSLVENLTIGTAARFWHDLLANGLLSILVPALIPLAIGISILRYRLWDIDVIIRKTLVYAVLTAVLAGVYFGTVVVLQTVFGSLTGEQSPVVIVVSTLVIAALFGTLRRRVQRVIDRRFFRQKYDAEQTLDAFAETARDEMSLEALTGEVTRVVQETLQPGLVNIWLKESGTRRHEP